MYADIAWSWVISRVAGEPSRETLPGWRAIPVIIAWKESTVTPAGGMSCREMLTSAAPWGDGGALIEAVPPPQPATPNKINDITPRIRGLMTLPPGMNGDAWEVFLFDSRAAPRKPRGWRRSRL